MPNDLSPPLEKFNMCHHFGLFCANQYYHENMSVQTTLKRLELIIKIPPLTMACPGMYILQVGLFFPNRVRPGSIFSPIYFFFFACFKRILTLSMALNLLTMH